MRLRISVQGSAHWHRNQAPEYYQWCIGFNNKCICWKDCRSVLCGTGKPTRRKVWCEKPQFAI